MIKNQQMEIEKRKEFLEIRKHYIDTAHKSSGLFDNTLISLGIGALGGSMYFVNSRTGLVDSYLLVYTWLFLGISVGLTVISFAVSEKVNRLSVDKRDEENTNNDCNTIAELDKEINGKNSCLSCIQNISIAALLLGVIFLSKFLFVNIK